MVNLCELIYKNKKHGKTKELYVKKSWIPSWLHISKNIWRGNSSQVVSNYSLRHKLVRMSVHLSASIGLRCMVYEIVCLAAIGATIYLGSWKLSLCRHRPWTNPLDHTTSHIIDHVEISCRTHVHIHNHDGFIINRRIM